MGSNQAQFSGSEPTDRDLCRLSPFLSELMGDGVWKETVLDHDAVETEDYVMSLRHFRRDLQAVLDDTEEALTRLRRLRVRTMLALARTDLADAIRPHELRARLRTLAEALVQGAWWVAEAGLRSRFVHPLLLERRNVNPPMAIFSLSRLGAGEPWYTTGPAPIFVHSRAAEFAPALTEKDLALARRSGKEWPAARDYFHRLARRTMSYLSIPVAAGRGYDLMAEEQLPGEQPALLPGALVVLYSAFEEHFVTRRTVKERLALIRLRFIAGQTKLGQAVEAAARDALLRTAAELGARLPAALKSWYQDRARVEGLPLTKGSLLSIEYRIRLAQFRVAPDDLGLLDPSPLRALDRLTAAGLVAPQVRSVLTRAYNQQWILVNRLCLLGRRSETDWAALAAGRPRGDWPIPDPGSMARLIREAREALEEMGT